MRQQNSEDSVGAEAKHAVQADDADQSPLLERGEAIGGPAAYAPPQRRANGDKLPDRGDASRTSTREDLRRIKSLSPPRRSWRQRPQPITNIEGSPSQLGPAEPSAPSSAPSEFEQHAIRQVPAPSNHLNRNDASTTPHILRSGGGGGVLISACEAQLNQLGQQRPFSPPVIPVGKLLRSVYDSARNGGPLSAAAAVRQLEAMHDPTSTPGSSKEPPGAVYADAVPTIHKGELHGLGLRTDVPPAQVHQVPDAFKGSAPSVTNALGTSPEGSEGQMLEAIYDPVLDVYYDPRSNKYYERRHDDYSPRHKLKA